MNQESPNTQLNNLSKAANVFDMVKIKVHLDEHFYIFSRFLISRMLTLSRVKKLDAIQIAKDIKKSLIERNLLDVSQNDLEFLIFQTMIKFGYTNNVQKFKMVSNFYRNRTPMIIMIFGAPCIGKSLLANNLAERLNISNVLQTDIVEMVMKSMESKYFETLSSISEFDGNEDKFVLNFRKSCRIIRKGVSTDISKCLSEGKAVIIEGLAALPNHYFKQIDNQHILPKPSDEADKEQMTLIQNYISGTTKLKKLQRKDLTLFNRESTLHNQFKIIYPAPEKDELEIEAARELKLALDLDSINQSKALIVGFLPIINKNDHLYNIENNLGEGLTREDIQSRLNCYQIIQQQLLLEKHKCIVFPINLHNLEESLDTIHDVILQKISLLQNYK